MGDLILLSNFSRPLRLIELSNATQMASRTLAENSQNTQSRANESKCRAEAMGGQTCPRRTLRTVLRRTRQSAPRLTTHSAFYKTDAPEPQPIPCAQSTKAAAFAGLLACPSPYSLDVFDSVLYRIIRRL